MASGKDRKNDAGDANLYQPLKKNKSRGDDSDSDQEKSDDCGKMPGDTSSSHKMDDQATDHPFSFRKFLVKDTPQSTASPRPSRHFNHDVDVYDSVPDIASDLPDFVQDRVQRDLSRRESNGDRIRSASELSLPDFVIGCGTNDAPCTADSTYSTVFPSINAIGSLIGRDEIRPVYGRTHSASSGARNDVPRPGLVPSYSDTGDDVNLTSTKDELLAENRRLRDENGALRRQLLETRDLGRHESERVAQLVQQVQTLQNHEAYETAALERMVQQVETNLGVTTDRAVHAESIVSEQKQEIELLREQLASIQMSNGEFEPMDEIRDRTQYMSEQLSATATNAETALKQMLSGVQNLKLMSDILLSIGKIYDDPEEDTKKEAKQSDCSDDCKTSEKNTETNNSDNKPNSTPDSSGTDTFNETPKVDKKTNDVRPKTKVNSGVKKKPVTKSQKEGEKMKK